MIILEKLDKFKDKRKKVIYALILSISIFVFIASIIVYVQRSLQQVSVSSTTLPSVGNRKNLERLVKKAYPKPALKLFGAAKKETADSGAANGGAVQGYSTTNTQVQGVDEGDTVKTDGEYIYKISGERYYNPNSVQLIKAYPTASLAKTSEITYNDINPMELYIKKNLLIVVGRSNKNINPARVENYGSATAVLIYDIKDKFKPDLIREIYVDGYYASSRMTGGYLYVISNRYIQRGSLQNWKDDVLLPGFTDSISGKEYKSIGYEEIKYCQDALEPNFVNIASIDTENLKENVEITSLLGSANNIFCSPENLYIAGYNYSGEQDYKTKIYKFSLNAGKVSYNSAGEVEGNILNQFSMDEYKGFFRITTTSQAPGRDFNSSAKNNVYILDGAMNPAGKLQNLAKGERIYSTRFMGDKAYMVTFKNTDPLFVLDVKDPYAPKVLGELKIPGFSNYLHPYDENHIIGIGKDAEVVTEYEREIAYHQGMKLAIFDVSDVHNPKQKFMTTIGDRGTESELLYNHKALLFSKEKNLLAFPVTVTKVPDTAKESSNAAKAWGQPIFVGAYVYNVDLEKGFQHKGSITHFKNGISGSPYDAPEKITRVLYIGDNLYTVSNKSLKVNTISNIQEIKTVDLR
jgi:inhibitor of cysteine peptidase